MSGSTAACLVILDVSGYTRYLAGVELDHARDILADLMQAIGGVMRPTFTLYKLEGDALFFHAPSEALDGSIVMDLVEGAYFAFRQRLFSIQQATTCECQACSRIEDLDLKVVAHHGEIVIQEMLGQFELVGQDVIVVHRMLKNSITESAYAFLSDDCVAVLGISPSDLAMRRNIEDYEHIGEVSGWVHDLGRVWAERQQSRRVHISDDDAAFTVSAFFAAPPELVWEHISAPRLRVAWGVGLDRIDQLDPSGRRRTGTLNHCVHGQDVMIQEFIDWQPPRYFTSRVTMPDGVRITSTHEVEPVEGGSTVHDRFASPEGEAAAEVLDGLRGMFEQIAPIEAEQLSAMLAEALNVARTEPALPESDEAHRLATSIS